MEDNTIRITKKDDVYVKLECEPHISKELSMYFTFFVPGHEFSPLFRKRKWDGKIRLFDLRSNTIYMGLISYIEEFAEERGYKVEYLGERPDVADDFSLYLAKKFVSSLKLYSHGEDIEPYEYQMDAFIHGMRHRRALLLSPTATGKSLIIYMLVRQFLDYKHLKGLVIVPTTSLVEQIYGDFQDYSKKNGFDVEGNVNRIYDYAGMVKQTNKPITISTWQSLYTMEKGFFRQFDYVIGDEAHQFKADSLGYIMTSCTNTKYRIGLTGSLDNTKTHKLVLEGLFGPLRRVTTTREQIDKGRLADLNIKCLILKHPEKECIEIRKKKDYKKELEYLNACESRNKFIRNLALSLDNNTLILFNYVEKHGRIIYEEILRAKNLGNKKVYFIHGGVETEDRETIRKLMEESSGNIIVASYGTFSTGINIRNLDNLIFASPSKSRIRNLQSIGRSLRRYGDKVATLFDIADDMRVDDRMNTTLSHFVERVKLYTEEKFNYKLYKIGLKSNG